MKIALIAEAEKPQLWRYLQDYIRELSPFEGRPAPLGDVPYPYFDDYWREPQARWPFWGLRDDVPAAFALVRKEADRFTMAEFYCLPPFRRAGFGLAFARALLARHPGRWEITEFAEHAAAVAFWRRVASDHGFEEARYVGEQSGQPRRRQTFTVPGDGGGQSRPKR